MVFQRVVRGKLRSDFQMVRGDRVAVKVDVVYIERVDDQMSQSMSFWRDTILVLSWRPGVMDGSTTIRLRTFRLRHLVYRHFVYIHFVYYCIPACRTVIHPTSVSANHYIHQFQLLLTLWFLFINPASTCTMIIQHNSYQALQHENPASTFS